jgi:hypothetical protein
MNIMTPEELKRIQQRYLEAIKPWNGNAWRPQLSEEEKKQREEDIAKGRIPF